MPLRSTMVDEHKRKKKEKCFNTDQRKNKKKNQKML
jgi:hypothetical protein